MVKKPIEMAGTIKLNCSMVYFIVEIRKCNYLNLRSQISLDLFYVFRFNKFYFQLNVRC